MIRLTAAVVATVLCTSPAAAFTSEQENVLNHIAEALAVVSRCPDLTLNDQLAAFAGLHYGLPMHESWVIEELRGRVPAKQRDVATHTDEIVCATGKMLYGDSGINVPKLLIAR